MTEYDNDPQRPGPGGAAMSAGSAGPGTGIGPGASAGPAATEPAATEPAAGEPATQHLPAAEPATQHLPVAEPGTAQEPHQASLPPWAVPVGGVGAASYPPQPSYPQPPYQQAPYQQGAEAAQPSGPYPGQPGAPQSGPPYPGMPAAGPYPGAPGGAGGGLNQPPWAQPVSGGHRPPGRAGRLVVTGAAAVVLAIGSGLLGGFIATQLDEDPTPISSTSGNRPAAVAPVIQRDSLATIAEKVQPSVVSISTGSGEGSGVVFTADGYVLTNNHVVASAQGDTVSVVFSDGKTAKGKIIGTDPRTDLAVVKVDGVSGLRPATFGDSSSMLVGDTVLALGSPLGLQGSVTAGIVSALDRTIQVGGEQQQEPQLPGLPQRQQQSQQGVQSLAGLLQTDAPINPGNSGGALVNLNGEVIGINTAIATSGQGEGNIGVGFAIPSNRAKQVAEQLRTGEKVKHPFLGVSVTDAEGGNGALVSLVQEGSPAARVGVQKGDVITQLGGKKINDSDDLVSAVQAGKVGDRLELTYIRNGEQKTATVALGEAS